MSNKINDAILEEFKDRFDMHRDEKNWGAIQALGVELQEAGVPELEIKFISELTSEELEEMRAWDIRVNGSTEAQMDDDS